MGGRGSGGGKSGGGGESASKAKAMPKREMTRDELVNLYNSISGNPAYSVEQRTKEMGEIYKKIQEIDAKKTADLKQKRLEALAKARAKRAENLKNGIKPEKKKEKDPKKTKPKMSMDSTVSDLKYNLRRNVDTDGYISNSDFRVEDNGNYVNVSVRYLGKWKNPSHARYEEDYDWQELKSSSGKQIDKVIKKMAKQSGRKITWGASEKNWIDIDIPKMKGD